MAAERRFRAMGSDAHLVVVGGPDRLVDDLHGRIADLEARWSRFVPTSEVVQLTERAGECVPVSADTRLLVERAVEAWWMTGGSFDPTVLGDVLRAGYDRSFDELADAPAGGPLVTRSVPSSLGLGTLDIAITAEGIALPPGTGFDAGGIGKGLAADLVVAEAMDAGAEGICVNLGGDLRVDGSAPDGGAWTIAMEHPASARPLALVGMTSGAVATSTTLLRTWTSGDTRRHHLIDPFTGEPCAGDVQLASVIAGEAWIAEVLAKSVLLRGSMRAFDLIDPRVAQALVVDETGTIRTTPGFTAYTGGVSLPAAISALLPQEQQS